MHSNNINKKDVTKAGNEMGSFDDGSFKNCSQATIIYFYYGIIKKHLENKADFKSELQFSTK